MGKKNPGREGQFDSLRYALGGGGLFCITFPLFLSKEEPLCTPARFPVPRRVLQLQRGVISTANHGSPRAADNEPTVNSAMAGAGLAGSSQHPFEGCEERGWDLPVPSIVWKDAVSRQWARRATGGSGRAGVGLRELLFALGTGDTGTASGQSASTNITCADRGGFLAAYKSTSKPHFL